MTNPFENQNKLELILSSNHRHPSNYSYAILNFKQIKNTNLKKGNTRQPNAINQLRKRFAIFFFQFNLRWLQPE